MELAIWWSIGGLRLSEQPQEAPRRRSRRAQDVQNGSQWTPNPAQNPPKMEQNLDENRSRIEVAKNIDS